MISASGLISLVVWLAIAGLLYWLVLWLLGELGVPEPFNKAIRVICAVVVFLVLVNVLLSFVGHPLVRF